VLPWTAHERLKIETNANRFHCGTVSRAGVRAIHLCKLPRWLRSLLFHQLCHGCGFRRRSSGSGRSRARRPQLDQREHSAPCVHQPDILRRAGPACSSTVLSQRVRSDSRRAQRKLQRLQRIIRERSERPALSEWDHSFGPVGQRVRVADWPGAGDVGKSRLESDGIDDGGARPARRGPAAERKGAGGGSRQYRRNLRSGHRRFYISRSDALLSRRESYRDAASHRAGADRGRDNVSFRGGIVRSAFGQVPHNWHTRAATWLLALGHRPERRQSAGGGGIANGGQWWPRHGYQCWGGDLQPPNGHLRRSRGHGFESQPAYRDLAGGWASPDHGGISPRRRRPREQRVRHCGALRSFGWKLLAHASDDGAPRFPSRGLAPQRQGAVGGQQLPRWVGRIV
jgi:hypothetical protein